MTVAEARPADLPLSRDFSTTHSVLHLLLRFHLDPLAAGIGALLLPDAENGGNLSLVVLYAMIWTYDRKFAFDSCQRALDYDRERVVVVVVAGCALSVFIEGISFLDIGHLFFKHKSFTL
ncbi:hypothetical protein B296_00045521, partial [Ensete ventricosum]